MAEAGDSVGRFIGYVSAGFSSPARDYHEEDIDLSKHLMPNKTSIYFARIDGDSMEGAHIPHNALVVIDKSLRAKNNSIVIATLDGSRIIKRFVKTHAGLFLSPSHPAHKPIQVTEEMDFAVWGVVTHVIVELVK
jgi:DNA polymerase V